MNSLTIKNGSKTELDVRLCEGYGGRRSRCAMERQRNEARKRSEPRNKPDPERSEGAHPKKIKYLEISKLTMVAENQVYVSNN